MHVVCRGCVRLVFVYDVILEVDGISIVKICMEELRICHYVASGIAIKCVWIGGGSIVVPTKQGIIGVDVVGS